MYEKKNCVLAPPGLEPTTSGSKQKRLRPVGHGGTSRQSGNLLILNDTCALSVINILFFKENGYLRVIACNSGTQMRVRDSSATRIFTHITQSHKKLQYVNNA